MFSVSSARHLPHQRCKVRSVLGTAGKNWTTTATDLAGLRMEASYQEETLQMLTTTAQAGTGESSSGLFNFLDETVRPSLFRNGEVLTKRDSDGNDSGTVGMVLDKKELVVHNARALSDDQGKTCEANGFELLNAPLNDENINFFDHDEVAHDYYAQCAHLVAEKTGARAFAFDHNIRSASGKQSRKRTVGGQQVQEPLHLVHGDYTLYSAPQRLRDLTQPPTVNDTYRSTLKGASLVDPMDAQRALEDGRFAIINVWRNIADTPVAVHPLALCDGQRVDPHDLVVFEIHYQDRVGENYFARHSAAHLWYYYPKMTRAEALLIKQWDSAGALAQSNGKISDAADVNAPCTFSFHSAFEDPAAPADAPDRWSIEVRCMVIYD